MLAFVALPLLLTVAPVVARKGVMEHDGHARSVEISMCGTQQPDDALLSIHSELSAQKKLRKVKPRAPESFIIDTYLHFVVTEDTAYLYPPEKRDQLATAQLKALNTAFAPLNITFNQIVPATFTINTTWGLDGDDLAMKTALRAGTYSSLNIYLQSNLTNPGTPWDPTYLSYVLGYCSIPTTGTKTSCLSSPSSSSSNGSGCTSTSYAPTSYVDDGCNILLASLPGGPLQKYNQGKTAVHEVGHWFGLMHTFQGGSCDKSDRGDFIDDTPQEMTETDDCPVGKDSCPGSEGLDPINNYMDYSSDACYTNFSPMQQQRIIDMYKMLRLGN